MLYIDAVNAVLQKLRQDPITDLSTDPTTVAYRVQLAVNRAIARIWNHSTWSFKRRTDTLTLSATIADYTMPKRVGEIYSVLSDQYPYKILTVPKHLFDSRVPNPTASGSPEVLIHSDSLGVSAQPSSASIISCVSSDASDTTQTILIKGIVGGQEDYEEIVLSGTVTANGSKLFTSIDSITKSALSAGRVTITSNGATVTNLIMGPLEKTLRLRMATFYPTPGGTYTITIHHFLLPPTLTRKFEDTLIPDRWNYVIDQWAFALSLQPQGQDQTTEFTNQMNLAVQMLDEDMAAEEIIAIDDPLVSVKAGDGGRPDLYMAAPPAGTNYIVP